MIPTLIGVGVTCLLALGGAIFAYGRNVQAVTTLVREVSELRSTVANALARLGRLEGMREADQEFSGRVR